MIKKLKLICGILILSGLVAINHSPIYADDIKVMLDGEYVDFDPTPVFIDDVLYVPVRTFAEMLRAEVRWFENRLYSNGSILEEKEKKVFLSGSHFTTTPLTRRDWEEDTNFGLTKIMLRPLMKGCIILTWRLLQGL